MELKDRNVSSNAKANDVLQQLQQYINGVKKEIDTTVSKNKLTTIKRLTQ